MIVVHSLNSYMAETSDVMRFIALCLDDFRTNELGLLAILGYDTKDTPNIMRFIALYLDSPHIYRFKKGLTLIYD